MINSKYHDIEELNDPKATYEYKSFKVYSVYMYIKKSHSQSPANVGTYHVVERWYNSLVAADFSSS
jgi:hypothetical protein